MADRMTPERLAEILQTHNEMRRYAPISSGLYTRDVGDLLAEIDRLRAAVRGGHVPMRIGTHDAQGHRTFEPPGDVCRACSDPDAGHWVPISQCATAWAVAVASEDWPDYGAPTDG